MAVPRTPVAGSLPFLARGIERAGYRRIAALRYLGGDRAEVECWPEGLAQALLGVLARTRRRSFAPIEEAFLLRELISGASLTDVSER
ncbi:MAG TPA: hypothetical protein PKA30_16330 [Accumulibacter sp.]|uniref:hypothetical protein n=1 Tax=Accumulibacter sp. TaxID=2053492 RepID=UPI002D0C79A6|nr:hypothetical protein [Accumulibacter sp.]HMV07097.1 hypothetical protein [Accumulibacter sp.]HNJ52003.1 hypothetical protein [Accumulibacter sp.]